MDTQKLTRALEELKLHSQGRLHLKKTKVRLDVVDVKRIRTRLGMTQLQFADTFLFPISTLRNWEQGSREPDGSARVLLKLIENDPDYIKQEIEQIQAVA